ncbi:MAG: inorganic phosphate transporter [FCB group bacterium]|nr:inorganic phosphate transporter [FCB group bacterium]
MFLLFLTSGLFLGWSLGANDASNIFGTAVGTRMVKFRTAAIIASLFVIMGATFSGAGTSNTLGKLGSVNQLAGAFIVALAAAISIFIMTRSGLPVSTSQAIVGGIIGWNIYSGTPTDITTLTKIVSSWVSGPLLAAAFAFLIYKLFLAFPRLLRIHLFRLDAYTRMGLITVGAFGAYSLGANNIANVMGVFVPVSPFHAITVMGITISSTEQLFLLGGISIAVGIFTYSQKVMTTVGEDVLKLTPQAALVVVLAGALVLFLFSSESLEQWLIVHNLPTLPLVPISSSQVIIGAIIGIGVAHGGRGIQYQVLGRIASGWVLTPIIAAVISFVALFFMENVFKQPVYLP